MLQSRNLSEDTVLEPTARHMRLHLFVVAYSLVEPPVALVVLGVVLLRSAPLYPALGVCVLGWSASAGILLIFVLYIK